MNTKSKHGFILDKDAAKQYAKNHNLRSVPDGGCSFVKVPCKVLKNALKKLSKNQSRRLKEAGLL